MEHLLTIDDLTTDDITQIFANTRKYKTTIKESPVKKIPTLKGKTVVNLFFENSTRTRSSFEIAGKWLGADVINISTSVSSVQKGESIQDTVQTISSLGADLLVVRHPVSGVPRQIADWLANEQAATKVINAGDGMHAHPTQALLDAFTILENFKSLEKLEIAIVGDILHSRVARSNIALLNKLGANVTLVAPKTLLPNTVNNWEVQVESDLDAVLAKVDVLMLLRIQAERMQSSYFPDLREYSIRFGLNKERAKKLKSTAKLMHPGPMLRGVEIAYEIAEQANSLVLDQVNNGVYLRMAILELLLMTGEESNE